MSDRGLLEKFATGLSFSQQRLKTQYKLIKYRRLAEIGEGLSLCARSECHADKPGLIKIGSNCEIFGSLQSVGNGTITIGNNTCIYERSIVGSVSSVSIGSYVIISNQVHIYDNNNHPTSRALRHQMCEDGFHTDAWRWTHAASSPIVIEDDVWIGENATILKGVTIGAGAIVGCNAVVTKDVPSNTIVAGNPARVVKVLLDE